jgi:hypothetical protein
MGKSFQLESVTIPKRAEITINVRPEGRGTDIQTTLRINADDSITIIGDIGEGIPAPIYPTQKQER